MHQIMRLLIIQKIKKCIGKNAYLLLLNLAQIKKVLGIFEDLG